MKQQSTQTRRGGSEQFVNAQREGTALPVWGSARSPATAGHLLSARGLTALGNPPFVLSPTGKQVTLRPSGRGCRCHPRAELSDAYPAPQTPKGGHLPPHRSAFWCCAELAVLVLAQRKSFSFLRRLNETFSPQKHFLRIESGP